jgi:hypothetical protein
MSLTGHWRHYAGPTESSLFPTSGHGAELSDIRYVPISDICKRAGGGR